MGKLDKLKKVLNFGLPIAGSFLGVGKAKDILGIVTKGIEDPDEPNNESALKHLAEVADAQTEVLTEHEERIRALEAKLK